MPCRYTPTIPQHEVIGSKGMTEKRGDVSDEINGNCPRVLPPPWDGTTRHGNARISDN
jgi:hypothetical protein